MSQFFQTASGALGDPVTVPHGGTGRTSLTDGAFLIGDGVNPVELLGPATDGQIPIGNTAGPSPVLALPSSSDGSITITPGAGSLSFTGTQATTVQIGSLETATDAEAIAKASLLVALTPSNLAAINATDSFSGLVELATDAEAIAKADATKALTPANLAALGGSETFQGLLELATTAETTTGTSTSLAVHPSGLNTKLGVQTTHGLIYGQGGAGNNLGSLGEASNGQIPIGSTGNIPVLSTLTAGTGISISNGSGSITISGSTANTGNGQTVGAVTADLITLALGATPGTYALSVSIAGFESGTPAGCGYELFGAVRTTGAAATLVGIPDKISNEEAFLAAADADIVVSGNNAIVRVTGVVALTIDWRADLTYTFRG